MVVMTRRALFALIAARALLAGEQLRGTLEPERVLRTSDGRRVPLTGDDPTLLVLDDKRLHGADFEVDGAWDGKQFRIGPIHLRSMFVHRSGQRLAVSYWCDICYIRTWSPGTCWCCQEHTKLDPIDPATLDSSRK